MSEGPDFAVAVGMCDNCDEPHLVIIVDGEVVISRPLPAASWDAMFIAHSEVMKLIRERQGKKPNAN